MLLQEEHYTGRVIRPCVICMKHPCTNNFPAPHDIYLELKPPVLDHYSANLLLVLWPFHTAHISDPENLPTLHHQCQTNARIAETVTINKAEDNTMDDLVKELSAFHIRTRMQRLTA